MGVYSNFIEYLGDLKKSNPKLFIQKNIKISQFEFVTEVQKAYEAGYKSGYKLGENSNTVFSQIFK